MSRLLNAFLLGVLAGIAGMHYWLMSAQEEDADDEDDMQLIPKWQCPHCDFLAGAVKGVPNEMLDRYILEHLDEEHGDMDRPD